MQGFEFLNYFEKFPYLKKHYRGIFAIDTLPKVLKYRQFMICNSDTSNGTGQHWFCYIKTEKSKVECFDSLGINDEKKLFLESHKFRGVKELHFNETQFQESETNTCGLFTIYFIIERMHNLDVPFLEILEELFDANDLKINENRVKIFCDQILNNG